MLIARALPVMRVYVKPGGQQAYKGHCINLPQDLSNLTATLPHYPKDLPGVIFKVKGKKSSTCDVTVQRQKILITLLWLMEHNPHYNDVTINEYALNCLPQNSVPHALPSLETLEPMAQIEPDTGLQNCEDDTMAIYWRCTIK